MKKIVSEIRQEVSQKRLYASVKEVSNFHRIQASTGFREAAQFVCHKLNDLGIKAQILSFRADEDTWYLQQKMFREWDCRDAWLELVDTGERIADFKEEPISIIQKSYPCNYTDQPLDIVLVESNDEAYLDGLELKGKMAFIHTMPNAYMESVIAKRGAVGFITDFMREVPVVRERNDAYDTLNYTSFWWKHTPEEPQTFGFVLSPRQGDRLKKLCLEKEAAYQKDPTLPRYPQAKAFIDAALYPGHMEVVEAVLPGLSDEEIIMCAHLCHPRSSANDNASGVAGSMEAMRVLKQLTASGKIPPLKRTIRLLLVPEMTGTYCYLSTLDHYDHIKGAINMDMIGGKQDGFYGPITITATHHAINSPITSIASMVLKYTRQQAPAFMGDPVPLVNSIIEAYTGGSDHIIFSDTSIGVPCIMLGQWPDKYYHTSSDTLECVDPNVLAFSTTFAAGFVYALSNFDEAMHQETMLHHVRLLVSDLEKINETETDIAKANRAAHFIDYYASSTAQFTRFGAVDTQPDADYVRQIGAATTAYLDLGAVEPVCAAEPYGYVPARTVVGPINDTNDYGCLSPAYQQAIDDFEEYAKSFGFMARMMGGNILNYVDGKRTLNEIWEAIVNETGKGDIDFMDHYVKLLVALDLVKIQ